MALSLEDVRKVARLARLRLDEGELARYQEQLGRVLEHMADLAALELGDVPPTAHALGLTNVLRPDEPAEAPEGVRRAVAANFPEHEGPYLKVPKVIE